MTTFFIPYPPSVNNYWGFHGNRRYLTKKAKEFKDIVNEVICSNKITKFYDNRLEIEITLFPPDKRKRDIDNTIKSCLDALCQAGLFNDDSQIDVLLIQRGSILKGGKTEIKIKKLL